MRAFLLLVGAVLAVGATAGCGDNDKFEPSATGGAAGSGGGTGGTAGGGGWVGG